MIDFYSHIKQEDKKSYTVLDVLGDGGLLSKVIDNYKQRDGQIKISQAINESYSNHETVIVNAPTGNGKSLSGLVPAILNKKYGKTIISTATKSLQDQYANKDIPMLHKILDFNSHVLKGRDNYVCNEKFARLGQSVISKTDYSNFCDWFNNTTTGDFEELSFVLPQIVKSKLSSTSDDCLESDCPYYKSCFYRLNKAKAISSDVVVINHDLLALSLILKNNYNVDMFGDVYSIIVDEAHKLEEIMTKYLGFKINVNSCRSFVNNIYSYSKACLDKNVISEDNFKNITFICDTITDNMKMLFNDFVYDDDKTYRLYPKNLDKNLCNGILTLISEVATKLPNPKPIAYLLTEKVVKTYESIIKKYRDLIAKFTMLKDIDKHINEYVYYVDACDDIRFIDLNILPIDISSKTKSMLFERKKELFDGDIACVTLLSATLAVNNSFDFIKSRLGINEFYTDYDGDVDSEKCIVELSIPEIFDYKHQAVLYLPKGIIDPSNNQKDKHVFTNQLTKTIKELSDIVDGGILALFTSYSEMDKVYDMINGNLDRNILNQRLLPRQKLISEFKADEESVLLATKSMWEGVDIQGRACSCVIIDRIPFPVPSEPIIEARIDKIKENDGDWFGEYYLPIAIISLQQAFGRLIRTHSDLGMIVIMDNRLLSKPYGKKIIRSLPKCLHTRKIEKVELFYDIVRQKRALRNNNKR